MSPHHFPQTPFYPVSYNSVPDFPADRKAKPAEIQSIGFCVYNKILRRKFASMLKDFLKIPLFIKGIKDLLPL